MHPIDEAIFHRRLTRELLEEHAAKPLPAPGASYWGDRMATVKDPVRAASLAARDMGTALASLDRLSA